LSPNECRVNVFVWCVVYGHCIRTVMLCHNTSHLIGVHSILDLLAPWRRGRRFVKSNAWEYQ
jgi:hypothetical protein